MYVCGGVPKCAVGRMRGCCCHPIRSGRLCCCLTIETPQAELPLVFLFPNTPVSRLGRGLVPQLPSSGRNGGPRATKYNMYTFSIYFSSVVKVVLVWRLRGPTLSQRLLCCWLSPPKQSACEKREEDGRLGWSTGYNNERRLLQFL